MIKLKGPSKVQANPCFYSFLKNFKILPDSFYVFLDIITRAEKFWTLQDSWSDVSDLLTHFQTNREYTVEILRATGPIREKNQKGLTNG